RGPRRFGCSPGSARPGSAPWPRVIDPAATAILARGKLRVLGEEERPEQDQGDSGGLFRALAPAPADLGAERQPEPRGPEGLEADRDYHGGDRHAREADAESDGELVQADADPERDERQPVAAGDAARPLLLVLAARQQQPRADADHGDGGQVIGDVPDTARQRAAQRQADERHPALED